MQVKHSSKCHLRYEMIAGIVKNGNEVFVAVFDVQLQHTRRTKVTEKGEVIKF